ncbi:TPA: hypothetical protein RUX00_004287 [Aeromonas dhakensis]|nr:hypothetical protein [Aeromonas dhakensis]
MFGKIEGQRLHLAKMYIANYCIALAQQAGTVDVRHVVLNINEEFGLVNAHEAEALVSDVVHFYNCLVSQQVDAIDRGSYWKWKAISAFEAKNELVRELNALKA